MTKSNNIKALDIDNEDGFSDGAVDVGKPIMAFNYEKAQPA